MIYLVRSSVVSAYSPAGTSLISSAAGGSLSKYRCPGCGERSCSLACVKRHKAEKPCDGRRDPAAYFALGDGTDELLLRDYHFLEQAGKTVDGAGRALGLGEQHVGRRRPLRDAARHGGS